VSLWPGLLLPAGAGPTILPHVYANGNSLAAKLGGDLYQSLDPKFQCFIRPNPVLVQNSEEPVITPVAMGDGEQACGGVSLSAGYIDLLNHLAHAKAIDRVQPGYFEQYVANVARGTGSNALPDLPNIVDNRFWTIDVMNEQASYFNQMMGVTLAINFAYHYLGSYHQYSPRMLAGKLVPINTFIPTEDWEAGVKAGVLNCLNCAVAMDGAEALFGAIDKMPRRPAWAAFLAPPGADLKSLVTQMSKYQFMYFHGQLK
jgi:hypothetical protein